MREKWIPKVIPTEADLAATVGSNVLRYVVLEDELAKVIPLPVKPEPPDIAA